jgi:hypothetical protein
VYICVELIVNLSWGPLYHTVPHQQNRKLNLKMAPAFYDIGEPTAGTDPCIKSTKPIMTALSAMGHGGLPVQGIPEFDSHTAQRQWILEHLAGAFRVFGREGYAEGIAGHISVRDPEFSDRFWINPLAVHFSMMRVSDLICLDMQGNAVGGNRVSVANQKRRVGPWLNI